MQALLEEALYKASTLHAGAFFDIFFSTLSAL